MPKFHAFKAIERVLNERDQLRIEKAELLEACELAIQAGDFDVSGETQRIEDRIRATIAKARGGTHDLEK